MTAPAAQKEQTPRPPSLVNDRLRAVLATPQVDLSRLFVELPEATDPEATDPALSERIDSKLSDMEAILDEITPTQESTQEPSPEPTPEPSVESVVENTLTAPLEQFVQPVPEQQPVVLEGISAEGNKENEALSEYLQEVKETETPVEAMKVLVSQAEDQTGAKVNVTYVPSTEADHEAGKTMGVNTGGRWLFHLVEKLIHAFEVRGLLAAFKRESKPVQ